MSEAAWEWLDCVDEWGGREGGGRGGGARKAGRGSVLIYPVVNFLLVSSPTCLPVMFPSLACVRCAVRHEDSKGT